MPVNANWPRAEVVVEYSCLLFAPISLTAALPTGFPPVSRSTPLKEGKGAEYNEGMGRNTRKRKKARDISRNRKGIAKHYTQVYFVHDIGSDPEAIAAARMLV